MSIIAATMLMLAADPAPARTLTAEQVLAASQAKTSIGPDPCRKLADEEEIVVCGRRESPYSLPLYDPTDDDDASKSGGNRVGQMAAIRESESLCAKGSQFCRPPPLFNVFAVGGVLVKGIKKLIDGE